MSIEKIRAYFQADKYLTLTGVSIDVAEQDYAVCSLEIADKHLNAGGKVQGGAIYTLADSAFGVAANFGHLDRGDRKITVSQSAGISYFRPPKCKRLIATAKKLSAGRRVSVYNVELEDELGTKVAIMTINGYTVDLAVSG
ncbi:MAG: PaaI family thioesterase [Spirochaetaceae bacterium]|nr:PaaI family thioesterase [Spirochaetaceae bacterium]